MNACSGERYPPTKISVSESTVTLSTPCNGPSVSMPRDNSSTLQPALTAAGTSSINMFSPAECLTEVPEGMKGMRTHTRIKDNQSPSMPYFHLRSLPRTALLAVRSISKMLSFAIWDTLAMVLPSSEDPVSKRFPLALVLGARI